MWKLLDEAGQAGAGGSGSPATPTPQQPTPTPAAQQPSPAPAQPTQQQPSAQGGTPEGFVPIDQLRAVTAERDRLNREKEERETETQRQQGEWQKLAEKNEEKAKTFESRFLATARRAAFVASAAKGGNIADPEAAYKLALTDGRLNDVKVDDDGNAEESVIAKAVEDTLKAYAFLKSGNGSFGGERSGNQPESTTFDPTKADSRTLLREGIRRAGASGS